MTARSDATLTLAVVLLLENARNPPIPTSLLRDIFNNSILISSQEALSIAFAKWLIVVGELVALLSSLINGIFYEDCIFYEEKKAATDDLRPCEDYHDPKAKLYRIPIGSHMFMISLLSSLATIFRPRTNTFQRWF